MKGVFKTMVSHVEYFERYACEVKELCEKADIRVEVSGDLVYFYWREKGDTRGLPISGKKLVIDAIKEFMSQNIESPEEREVFEAMSDSVRAVTNYPRVNDEVSTRDGVGRLAAIVEQNGEEACIVQFENDWGVFDLKELRDETEPDYKAGRALRELFISCHSDSATQLGFDALTKPARNAWVELAKRVKVLDNA